MAKLTEKQVKHVAQLSHLTLARSEIKTFQSELSKILDHFTGLNDVDVSMVDPMSHPTGLTDVLAPDEPKPQQVLSAQKATNATEKIYNNYFVVKQLIDKDN